MDNDNKYICCSCAESLNLTKFYKSNSDFFSSGHLPICKECFGNKFWHFASIYHDKAKAMQRMCMAFDIYYDENLFNNCDTDDDTVLGKYFRKLNMHQYNDKSFEDCVKTGFDFLRDKKPSASAQSNTIGEQSDDVNEIDPADIEKWGSGFDGIDYNVLNTHYKLLKAANPNCDSNQEIFITDLCYTKMQQMKSVREGRVDDYNKLTDSYRKTFTQAGLKTVRDSSINEEFTIGITAETIEKYTPAEYYKNKELYHDFDNIGEYIERFLLRPLRNLMYGTKDRDYEYFVKEEENEDVYQEE